MKSRLGVNVDHIATLRNARGEGHPDPISYARQVMNFGANSITIHLREDRRHIRDEDVAIFSKIKSCLLYTSPSPRDLSTSRMPSSA